MIVEDFQFKTIETESNESLQEAHNFNLQSIIDRKTLGQFKLEELKNIYHGTQKAIFIFFYNMLKQWDDNISKKLNDTNWRMLYNIHQFIYVHLKIIELENQEIRSQNLQKLYNWYIKEYPITQKKIFNFIKSKHKIKNQNNLIRNSFGEDRKYEIINYKRRYFIQRMNQSKSIKKQTIPKKKKISTNDENENRIFRSLQKNLSRQRQTQQIQFLITQTINSKDNLKEKRYQDIMNSHSNLQKNTQLIPLQHLIQKYKQEDFLIKFFSQKKQLKLDCIQFKRKKLKKINNLSALSNLVPSSTHKINSVQGLNLIYNPFQVIKKKEKKVT